MSTLPSARGPLSEALFAHLRGRDEYLDVSPAIAIPDPLGDDDLQLALYCCYELHYRGFVDVDDRYEWSPDVLSFRGALEECFERALMKIVPHPEPERPIPEELFALAEVEDAPSVSRFVQHRATLEQAREFLIHRSAYQLKEADPHSWAIPRLEGRAKAALMEVQFDEYGSGDPDRIHATLYARAMAAVGLDPSYGAYLDVIPGVTLATVNIMSLFGLHRRWRGAIVGHLAMFEMSSSIPNRRYAEGLRRLGFDGDATDFFDEHVVADSVHEMIAAHDLAGAFDDDETLRADVVFGARASIALDERWARHVVDAWEAGCPSLLGAVAGIVE
ncbi:MAG TPA: iron-containing redox enzyme family protein [Actinomycetota bacterium]|nr:iron-containing redox enzyme family protein [Actinomycetota bacterium]